MALFSQRKGIRPLNKDLQHEFMDRELRIQLWNALHNHVWGYLPEPYDTPLFVPQNQLDMEKKVNQLWQTHFKMPVDATKSAHEMLEKIRQHYFEAEWWEVYDLIEALLALLPQDQNVPLKQQINDVLRIENAAYRIVGDEVAPITDEHEIEAIESAFQQGITETHTHLARGLELLKDRKQPDYRNSIKESISAVEAACKAITGMPKATLADCIREIEQKAVIHRAFKDALVKLYGYTSDEGGIRHGLTENSELPSFSEAKYMLVVCAAFVNYLFTKGAELGIEIRNG